MKILLMILGVMSLVIPNCFAMQIASFEDYDLSEIKYDNRICISNDINDDDFKASSDVDINEDGEISFLESHTFYSDLPECNVFIGNASSRYDLNNALVWIGVKGEFESFKLGTLEIRPENVVDKNDTSVQWPYPELMPYVDSVLLIDIESSIAPRTSSNDPISSCHPFSFELHSLNSDDEDFYAYVNGFGSIKSGFNSVSPMDSDLIWAPSSLPVAPEPSSLILFSIGGLGLYIKRKLMM
jgi:hypothetical protein